MQSYHLTQWVLFFFIYSFIGWVWECCFVSVRKRRWVNRGFMYGPDAADLWIRSACGLDQYDQSQRQYSVDLFIRHGWSNAVGIRYRGGYGETFQCEILGLQQSEI